MGTSDHVHFTALMIRRRIGVVSHFSLERRFVYCVEANKSHVMQVPDTSRVAALQASVVLQKTYREGFIKNRYVGRTFIMPGQAERFVSCLCSIRIYTLRRGFQFTLSGTNRKLLFPFPSHRFRFHFHSHRSQKGVRGLGDLTYWT
jgi:hypothetical protein